MNKRKGRKGPPFSLGVILQLGGRAESGIIGGMKRFATSLIIMTALLALAACGSNGTDTTVTESATSATATMTAPAVTEDAVPAEETVVITTVTAPAQTVDAVPADEAQEQLTYEQIDAAVVEHINAVYGIDSFIRDDMSAVDEEGTTYCVWVMYTMTEQEYEDRTNHGYAGTAYDGFGEVSVDLASGDAVLSIDGAEQETWNLYQ